MNSSRAAVPPRPAPPRPGPASALHATALRFISLWPVVTKAHKLLGSGKERAATLLPLDPAAPALFPPQVRTVNGFQPEGIHLGAWQLTEEAWTILVSWQTGGAAAACIFKGSLTLPLAVEEVRSKFQGRDNRFAWHRPCRPGPQTDPTSHATPVPHWLSAASRCASHLPSCPLMSKLALLPICPRSAPSAPTDSQLGPTSSPPAPYDPSSVAGYVQYGTASGRLDQSVKATKQLVYTYAYDEEAGGMTYQVRQPACSWAFTLLPAPFPLHALPASCCQRWWVLGAALPVPASAS